MKKCLLFGLLVLLIGSKLLAQDYPKALVFGGYQYTHIGSGGADINMNGWNASLTGNFNRTFGLTADFSGAYKSISGASAHVYTYTGGPVVSLNSGGKVNPFVHALFGGAHATIDTVFAQGIGGGPLTDNGFTMMFGGGADAKLSPAIAYRLFQADWVYYRFSGEGESKNVRISTGIVFRF